jgi:phage terminase small subunit
MRPPSDLEPKGRGRRFWTKATSTYSFTDSELEILGEACRTLDEIAALRAALVAEGVTATGSRGQPRVHPAVQEIRQARGELRRLVAALKLPAADGKSTTTPKSYKASQAARTRWHLNG